MRRQRWSRNTVARRTRRFNTSTGKSRRCQSRRPSSKRTQFSRSGYWPCRFEPLEARFFLSAAPGIDSALFGDQGALFEVAGSADSSYEAALEWPSIPSGVFIGDSEKQTALFDFAFRGAPLVEEIDGGVIVSLEGEPTWVSAGDPVVPVRESTILLPQGMEITSIEARYLDPGTAIAHGLQLTAAPAAIPFDGSGDSFDQPITLVSSPFGGQDAVAYSNYTVRGYNVAALRIFPVEYDAVADTLSYHSEISVTVTVEASESEVILPAFYSEADREYVRQLVDNPETADSYVFPSDASAAGSPALPMAGQYDYVIVTSSALEDAFEPLVSQKLNRGLSATIVTTEYIGAAYSGTETGDTADKIRNFIADAYANWGTRWVLLGGDAEVIPQRGVYASVGSTVDNNLPTDMYYACLDGPWNGDGDSLWGESNDGTGGGDIDLVPEVYLGRAPVSNVNEAANFVFKTVQYETTPHPNATTAVWLAEQLDSETWGSYSGIPIRDQSIPDDWNLIERYDSAGGWSGTQFRTDLNASPHLVNHLGHTNETYNARLTNSTVAGLVNEAPYFMYSQGCMSGSFDTHDISIGEQHVVDDHGAFGVVMNSRYGWYIPGSTPGASHYYAAEFWDAVLGEGLIRLGQANQDSKDDNLFRVGSTGVYRWIHFETNLFGDPETPFQIGEGLIQGGEIRGTVWDDVNADGQPQPQELPIQGQTVFVDLNHNGVLDLGTLSVVSDDVPVHVADNTTVTSSLAVSGGTRVADVNVTVDIAHTYDSDLEVYLVSPSGTRVELFTQVGAWGQNFTGTTLDDEAETSIADAAAPFSGTFRPEGLLSRFDGEDPNGTWTLEITDTMPVDTGTLNGWSLEIASEEPHTQTGSDGSYVFRELADGTYHVRHELPSGWIHTNPVNGVHVVDVQQGSVIASVDFLAAQVPPATPLGAVDFLEIAKVDLTGGDRWYSWQAVRQGYLTIEALVEGAADPQITLYDAGLNELATSTVSDAGRRIDWNVQGGQTYYLRTSGSSGDVDLRLANLVRQGGAGVVVFGTDGDDRLDFAAAEWHQLTINGVHYEFSSSVVTAFEFDGGAGSDTAVLCASTGDDTAVMHPSWATLTGPGYQAEVTNTAEIIILGEGGADIAHLYGSAGDDSFIGRATLARLYGDGFFNQVSEFRYVYAYAAGGGGDVAMLYDSSGDDVFVAAPDHAKLRGEAFYNSAMSFRYVHGFSSSGSDVAKLYDSAGDDVFVATPEYATLSGDGIYGRAVSFRYVHAFATRGGDDLAKLYDSPGDDFFVATPEYASLYGSRFYTRAVGFRYAYGFATGGGSDRAKLYDSPGDDFFVATPEYAYLYGSGFYNRAVAFRYNYGLATAGGNDVARLYDSAGDDVFGVTPEYGELYSDHFYNRAMSFRYVHAHAVAGGYDRAYLCDSAGDDHLKASGSMARLSGSNFTAWAHDFAWVRAISSLGGSDTKEVEAVDYVLQTRGPWTDV